jgi:Flp pilus assembly protein TadG
MRIGETARGFWSDHRGNIAIVFGLMVFVIFGGAGIAIDMQRSNAVRSEIVEATDAAILAAARYKMSHPNADDGELSAIGRRVFDNGVTNDKLIKISGFTIVSDPNTNVLTADVDGQMNALIMGMLGRRYINVGTVSQVKFGKPPVIEIAMALDVTGSMNQKGKIGALKDAAKDLVETLFEAEDADVMIGIVPFAQYANIGDDYDSATWLSNPGAAFKGCVGSRNYPYNTLDSDYTAQKVPGLSGAPCPDALMPLTTDKDALLTLIDQLDANGWTYIPAGLNPAWQLLTPTAPFTEGRSFEDIAKVDGMKTLILMTDGENTRAPDYPTHNSASEVLANELTEEICVNIKAQDIMIYTIAFDLTDPKIKAILEECATSPSHFFDAANAADLTDAFASIANSLRNISLSK